MVRAVKREPVEDNRNAPTEDAEAGTSNSGYQNTIDRRLLRSRYVAVKSLISDKRDDISKDDSDKFSSIISEVESLHELVQKPREQVADAETLLDLANTLVTCVKAHGSEGTTPPEFVSCILQHFGKASAANTSSANDPTDSVRWKDIGLGISSVFPAVPGCCTMLGPMSMEPKQRKAVVRRPREKPGDKAKPEELGDNAAEEKTDTDKNMSSMFDILKNNRKVSLEKLVLNRTSFAQTVENIFALSFLVKDGRAEITVDHKGQHLVSPRNAPAASSVASGEVSYTHFVFRFDFKDWKLMKEAVAAGEELMPHRTPVSMVGCSQRDSGVDESETAAGSTTPIRKLSRNRGLVLQDQAVAEDSTVSEEVPEKRVRKRRMKAEV